LAADTPLDHEPIGSQPAKREAIFEKKSLIAKILHASSMDLKIVLEGRGPPGSLLLDTSQEIVLEDPMSDVPILN
jgi:hypothetical protein